MKMPKMMIIKIQNHYLEIYSLIKMTQIKKKKKITKKKRRKVYSMDYSKVKIVSLTLYYQNPYFQKLVVIMVECLAIVAVCLEIMIKLAVQRYYLEQMIKKVKMIIIIKIQIKKIYLKTLTAMEACLDKIIIIAFLEKVYLVIIRIIMQEDYLEIIVIVYLEIVIKIIYSMPIIQIMEVEDYLEIKQIKEDYLKIMEIREDYLGIIIPIISIQ